MHVKSSLIKFIFVVSFVMILLQGFNTSIKLNLKSKPGSSLQRSYISTSRNSNQQANTFEEMLNVFKTKYQIQDNYLTLNMQLDQTFNNLFNLTQELLLSLKLKILITDEKFFKYMLLINSKNNLYRNISASDLQKQERITDILNLIKGWAETYSIEDEIMKQIFLEAIQNIQERRSRFNI